LRPRSLETQKTAKAYLKKNLDLLRQYIDEVDGPFLEAYSRKLGKTKETLLEERVNQLITNDERLNKFIIEPVNFYLSLSPPLFTKNVVAVII